MTVSNYVTPSASMNEEYMPEQELEQEGMLEEALEREPTEESADQETVMRLVTAVDPAVGLIAVKQVMGTAMRRFQ